MTLQYVSGLLDDLLYNNLVRDTVVTALFALLCVILFTERQRQLFFLIYWTNLSARPIRKFNILFLNVSEFNI